MGSRLSSTVSSVALLVDAGFLVVEEEEVGFLVCELTEAFALVTRGGMVGKMREYIEREMIVVKV